MKLTKEQIEMLIIANNTVIATHFDTMRIIKNSTILEPNDRENRIRILMLDSDKYKTLNAVLSAEWEKMK